MAATIIGTAYLFAPDSIGTTFVNADGSTATTGLTALVIGFSPEQAPANSVTETGLNGNVITERRDDNTITATVDILITAASTAWPVLSGRVTLASMTDTRWNVKYLIESVSAPIARGAHIQYSLRLKSNAIIAA